MKKQGTAQISGQFVTFQGNSTLRYLSLAILCFIIIALFPLGNRSSTLTASASSFDAPEVETATPLTGYKIPFMIGEKVYVNRAGTGHDNCIDLQGTNSPSSNIINSDNVPIVVAAKAGVVVGIKEDESGRGECADNNYVVIQSGDYLAEYHHIKKDSVSEFEVTIGSEVDQGQPIAKVGNTGCSDGYHLHFHVHHESTNVDKSNALPFIFDGVGEVINVKWVSNYGVLLNDNLLTPPCVSACAKNRGYPTLESTTVWPGHWQWKRPEQGEFLVPGQNVVLQLSVSSPGDVETHTDFVELSIKNSNGVTQQIAKIPINDVAGLEHTWRLPYDFELGGAELIATLYINGQAIKNLTRQVQINHGLMLDPGWNLISLPPGFSTTALTLLEQIDSECHHVINVSHWKQDLSRYEGVIREFDDTQCAVYGFDFNILPGEGIWILNTGPKRSWDYSGALEQWPSHNNLAEGWNFRGQFSSSYPNASDLLDHTSGAVEVSKWRNGGWVTYKRTQNRSYGEDFVINPNDGVIVRVSSSAALGADMKPPLSLPVMPQSELSPIRDVSVPDMESNSAAIVNATTTSVAIAWNTLSSEQGWIKYGFYDDELVWHGYDVRGANTSDRTHLAQLNNLMPGITYYFSIQSPSGASVPQIFTTAPELNTSVPKYTASGTVHRSDGKPAYGAIVYLTVRDRDGEGSPDRSATYATTVEKEGRWAIELVDARTRGLSERYLFTYTGGDDVEIRVDGGVWGSVETTVDTSAASPLVSTLVLPVEVHSIYLPVSLQDYSTTTDLDPTSTPVPSPEPTTTSEPSPSPTNTPQPVTLSTLTCHIRFHGRSTTDPSIGGHNVDVRAVIRETDGSLVYEGNELTVVSGTSASADYGKLTLTGLSNVIVGKTYEILITGRMHLTRKWSVTFDSTQPVLDFTSASDLLWSGDFNTDNQVDLTDYEIFEEEYQKSKDGTITPEMAYKLDLNGDGSISMDDYSVYLDSYNNGPGIGDQ